MLPRIIFHHVHKCAGTTLLKFLEGVTAHDRAVFVETLRPTGQEDDEADGTAELAALLHADFLHDPFGVHDWKELFGNAVSVLFLRDPVARLHSEWRMITRWDDALLARRDDRYHRLRTIARRGFVPFLQLPGARMFGNAVAHHLAFGDPVLADLRDAVESPEGCHAKVLDLLDARLAAIDFVGFVETFQSSFLNLVAALDLPLPATLQTYNSYPNGVALSAEERSLAESCTVIDRQLVAAARARAAAVENGRADDERLRRIAEERSRKRALAPPPGVLLNMGDGFVGSGWHPCEGTGRKRMRWIGPGPVATVALRIDRGLDLHLRMRVTSLLRSTQVNGLRIFADGRPCPVQHWVLPPFDHFFETTIPAAAGGPPLVHLAIDCVETVTPPNPLDPRQLGVGVEEIELGPADRYTAGSLRGLERVRCELAACARSVDGDRRMQDFLDSLPSACTTDDAPSVRARFPEQHIQRPLFSADNVIEQVAVSEENSHLDSPARVFQGK